MDGVARGVLSQVMAAQPPSPGPKILGRCAQTKSLTLARSVTCTLWNKKMFVTCDLEKFTGQ